MSTNTGNELKLLEHIFDGAQMGRDSITQLVKNTDSAEFRRALETQQREYESIMDDAGARMRSLGSEPEGTNILSKVSGTVMTAAKTMMDDSVANMAEMMIQGSTMGVTKLKRQLGELDGIGDEANGLAKRLIRTEESNIESMKRFL